MRKISIVFFIGFLMLLFTFSAHSTTLVDTGDTGAVDPDKAWSLIDSQWLAGEFTLLDDYIITDVESVIGVSQTGDATVAIYTDGGSIPGSELFSSSFSINSGAKDWYGVNGVSWSLTAGTYWAAFEVRSGQTFAGYNADTAVNPLNGSAWYWVGLSSWDSFTPENNILTLRVEGYSPVPEPATAFLVAFGILGIAGISRRKK